MATILGIIQHSTVQQKDKDKRKWYKAGELSVFQLLFSELVSNCTLSVLYAADEGLRG